MNSSNRVYAFSPTWVFALIGVIASLPVIAILDLVPNAEATVGGGIMIIGAFIAGVVAKIRSEDPRAAGLRAGFVGGLVGLLIFIVTAVSTATISLPVIIIFVLVSVLAVFLACLFGLVFGLAGGWVANTVDSRWMASKDAS